MTSIYPQTSSVDVTLTPANSPPVTVTITPPGAVSVPVSVTVEPIAVQVKVVSRDEVEIPFATDLALLYQTSKL